MPARSRRSRRNGRHAGAWRCFTLAPVARAIVALPGRSPAHARPASSTARASAAAAVRCALDQLGKRYQWGAEGQRGPAVAAVQSRLRASGACLAEDGSFGPVTLAAVRRFQRAHGLRADGVVGKGTWDALISNGRQRSRTPAC